jgi:hypothetical protein
MQKFTLRWYGMPSPSRLEPSFGTNPWTDYVHHVDLHWPVPSGSADCAQTLSGLLTSSPLKSCL